MRKTLLADCAARSRPLDSYLDPTTDVALPADVDPADLLDHWRDVFDSEEAFRDRLELSDHTVESARKQFRTAPADGSVSIPPCFETAEQVVDRAVELDRESVEPVVERHPDSPFVHLLAPLVTAIGERVTLDIDCTQSARESLDDWLFDRLKKGFRHPLFILFKAYQRDEYPETDFEDAAESTAVYDEFVASHREADYERLFEEYPVLLRFLGVVADQWSGAVRRLDDRVSADRADLARTFDDGGDLGRIVDVGTLSNDPHGEGEVVLRVDFESDCSVVYKPRSVAGERAFDELLAWVNARTDSPDLYTPTVLDRGEYGWMEFVPHAECDSTAAVERYYERMGAVSGLAFVLGSTDFHYENVVAMGEHPVIVDQETALSPRSETADAPSSDAVSSVTEETILDTLILPFTERTDGEELSTSGLSELAGEERRQKLPNFHRPNTDAMELTFDRMHRFDGRNLPRLGDEIRDVSDYLPSLKRGFRNVTTAVVTHRDELLDPSGPLAAFEGADVRYLLRPTGHYASKLHESRYSSKLRSGLDQSVLLESFYRIFVPRSDDGDLWKLVRAENETLRRFVVPRFTVEATGHELKDGRGNRLGAFVDESPVEHARRRISDLDDHWIETQLRLVDLTFTDSKVSDPVSAPSDDAPNSVPGADSPREVVSAVVRLLDDATTRRHDGSLEWAEPARSSPTDHLLIREPDADLYEGYAGVGLFLAAVAAVRDDAELADRSRRVLDSVESALDDAPAIGGMTGNGSVAYGLLTAGELLDDDDLVETAKTVASRTTREEIAADTELDVVAGSAGELLAQLAVYDRTGDDAALDRARWCGDRLLDAATETSAGYRVPTVGDAEHRFAFAHGVGGIGCALVKLGSALDDQEYARVGRETLRYDVDLWRRERDAAEREETPDTVWGWCNGLAGVGTSRVAVADSTTVADAGDFSLVRANVQSELSGEDSLCCGSAGRALFMLDAGEVFEDQSLLERGEDLFAEMLDRADREGRLRLANHLPMLPKLGLFTGVTGVGYTALRLEARDADVELPNVARLE